MPAFPPLLLSLLGMGGHGPRQADLERAVRGRRVLVTGASRGIGAALAGRLALAGAHVILLARSEPELRRLVRRIEAQGGSAEYVVCDLRDSDAAKDAGRRVLAGGVPDVIVSNAGLSIQRYLVDYASRFHDITRSTGVNFLGPVAMLLELLPHMRGGHLISVSSASVVTPAPGWSAYGASKSAFEAWIRAIAPELALQGIATTSLRLPLVHTGMSSAWRGLPGLSARGAASLVCTAIVSRPRVIAPWWVRIAGVLMDAAPAQSDRLMTAYARLDRQRPS